MRSMWWWAGRTTNYRQIAKLRARRGAAIGRSEMGGKGYHDKAMLLAERDDGNRRSSGPPVATELLRSRLPWIRAAPPDTAQKRQGVEQSPALD